MGSSFNKLSGEGNDEKKMALLLSFIVLEARFNEVEAGLLGELFEMEQQAEAAQSIVGLLSLKSVVSNES